MTTIRSIGISAKITSEAALRYAANVARELRARDFKVCFDERTVEALAPSESYPCVPKEKLGENAELLLTFGGDGTLLSVARHAPNGVPIIGVNMGTLGFLTEIRLEEFPRVLEDALEGNVSVEARVTFDVSVLNEHQRHFRVLNDAVITQSAVARIVEIWVEVGGQFVSSFRADGLIVATPTGSTAYNLSAGGPIIYPTMSAVVLTPICPHMLSNRPIVLPDNLEIEIGIVTPNQQIFLTLDGQEGIQISERDRVRVKKSKHTVTLVQSPEKNYFDVLRNKLKWGGE